MGPFKFLPSVSYRIQSFGSSPNQDFGTFWILIHQTNDVPDRLIGYRKELCQSVLPRCSAWSIRKDVCLSSDPDPNNVETLQFQSPVGHLFASPSIIKLGLAKNVILVVDVTVDLKPFYQPLMFDDSSPKSIEFSFHGAPTQLSIIKGFTND